MTPSQRASLPADSLVPGLRRAGAADTANIAALLGRAFPPDSHAAHTPSEQAVRALQQRGDFLVVDRRGGALAAAIFVTMDRCRGHLDLLAVDPECRGAGLGRRLIAVAEAVCEAEGCTAMDLGLARARRDLRPGLQTWYRSMGYREAEASTAGPSAHAPIDMTKALA